MQQKRYASNGSRFFCYGNDVITLPFLCRSVYETC